MAAGFSKEQMEEMIRRYQEEALRYKDKGNSLYREQIPAKEVSAPVQEEAAAPLTAVVEESTLAEEEPVRVAEEETNLPMAESMSVVPRNTPIPQGEENIQYAGRPVTVEEILQKSHFERGGAAYTDFGRLIVDVAAEERSLPISYANVMVLRKAEGEKELLRYLQTDRSGSTPAIELPAPSRSLSDQPGTGDTIPCGIYTVAVSHAEYYTAIIKDVRIFAGQTAILPVSMIPLSEMEVNENTAPDITVGTDNHSLTQ